MWKVKTDYLAEDTRPTHVVARDHTIHFEQSDWLKSANVISILIE